MSDKDRLWTIQEIADKVDTEGLGYMVTDYLNPERIADEELRYCWDQAAHYLRRIETILEPFMP